MASMFQARHYHAIATVIRKMDLTKDQRDVVIRDMVRLFLNDNERFSVGRFEEASRP